MTLALSVRKEHIKDQSGSVCIVHICPDNMQMTCTYVDNSIKSDVHNICICKQYTNHIDNVCVWRQCVKTKLQIIEYTRSIRDHKQMMYTCVDNIQIALTMCVCVDNVQKLSCI